MLRKDLETTINLAFRKAREQRHELMTVEHLLLSLLDYPETVEIIQACGGPIDAIKRELQRFVRDTVGLLKTGDPRDTQPTLGFQRVLQRAVLHAQSSGKREVTGPNVLVALYGEQESHAVFTLKQYGISRLDVINLISHGAAKPEEAQTEQSRSGGDSAEAPSKNPLDHFTTNLNAQARQGKIDPLIGRRDEVERTIQILCRRRKNNPLLVGEAGVGKTAIAEGLARLIVEGSVPEILQESTIFALDLGSLVAGTKYRGDFEKRIKAVLAALRDEKGAILFIDEIHTVIGAGSASGGVMDASNLIKPMLASGEIKCIGSTTYQEFRGIFEKDRALARRFQKIDVVEPSIEESYSILRGLKSRFEDHHAIRYTDKALRAAVDLSARYINDRHLPDKAIDVIDEAGASQRLLPAGRRKKAINVQEIENIIAKMARIPPRTVSSSDKHLLRNLGANLRLVIFGQDEAINTLSNAITMARAGLGQDQKPIGSFLFAGPTGVGKTEVARQLAHALGINLIRFDMSEYMERHTVSRLIGAPPGYVGFDQGGLLTEAVLKQPHAVLLLDEIEKAHPDVFNLLLQVMDHGTLTDNNGRKSDFRNIVLIMTTNAGADQMDRTSMGFTQQDHSNDGMDVIRRIFSPEFRNRLDAIVPFKPLVPESVARVVDKFLIELEAQLEAKKVTFEVDMAGRAWLAQHGYDPKMGARPMARLIQEQIKRLLAEELLFGRLMGGGHVIVTVRDDTLHVDVAEVEAA